MANTPSAFSIPTAGSGGGGVWVALATLTASNSASLAFTNIFSSTYYNYVFVFTNVIPATTETIVYAQLGTGATPTYVTTGYNWQVAGVVNTSTLFTGATNDAQIVMLTNGGTGVYNGGQGFNGQMFVQGTNATSAIASGNTSYSYPYGANYPYIVSGTNGWDVAAATFTAIKFYFNTGNITSGIVDCYGILAG